MAQLYFILVLSFAVSVLAKPSLGDDIPEGLHVEKHHYLGDEKILSDLENVMKKQIKENKIKQSKIKCEALECTGCVDVRGFPQACTKAIMDPVDNKMVATMSFGSTEMFHTDLLVNTHAYRCTSFLPPMEYAQFCFESGGLTVTGNSREACWDIYAGDISWDHCAVYDAGTKTLTMT